VVLYIHYFIPQSWGFYTIEANVPLYNIYKVHNGIADKTTLIKNNMSFGMGMSRKGKILFDELYKIINKDLPWKSLNEDSISYITHNNKYTLIPNPSKDGTLNGNFLITKTDRPSYLNLKNDEKFHPAKQYILVDIR